MSQGMQPMQDVTSLAYQVNHILSGYILIHDVTFIFSIRRLLPVRGLFKALDYGSHLDELGRLHSELAQTLAAITHLRGSELNSSPKGEFLAVLAEYGAALSDTIGRLRNMCEHLYRKSQGAKDYRWSSYRRDMKAYNTSVGRYEALGQRLNPLWSTIMTERERW